MPIYCDSVFNLADSLQKAKDSLLVIYPDSNIQNQITIARQCHSRALERELMDSLSSDSLLNIMYTRPEALEALSEEGKRQYQNQANWRFCINGKRMQDSLAMQPPCDVIYSEIYADTGISDTKEYLWTYCQDNSWQPDVCKTGLITFCKDKERILPNGCKVADSYCKEEKFKNLSICSISGG